MDKMLREVIGNFQYRQVPYVGLLGIAGKSGSGKTRLVDELSLSPHCPYPFHREKLAKPMYALLHTMFPFLDLTGKDRNEIDDFLNVSPRELLQITGDDIRNKYGENALIYALYARIMEFDTKSIRTIVCIDDVRFDGEADFIRDLGGHIIHLTGKSFNPLKGDIASHKTEAGITHKKGELCIDDVKRLDVESFWTIADFNFSVDDVDLTADKMVSEAGSKVFY